MQPIHSVAIPMASKASAFTRTSGYVPRTSLPDNPEMKPPSLINQTSPIQPSRVHFAPKTPNTSLINSAPAVENLTAPVLHDSFYHHPIPSHQQMHQVPSAPIVPTAIPPVHPVKPPFSMFSSFPFSHISITTATGITAVPFDPILSVDANLQQFCSTAGINSSDIICVNFLNASQANNVNLSKFVHHSVIQAVSAPANPQHAYTAMMNWLHCNPNNFQPTEAEKLQFASMGLSLNHVNSFFSKMSVQNKSQKMGNQVVSMDG
ncbi:hypothetical protein RCL1_006456 [Eukaryota sp. TZLM3-RCL]